MSLSEHGIDGFTEVCEAIERRKNDGHFRGEHLALSELSKFVGSEDSEAWAGDSSTCPGQMAWWSNQLDIHGFCRAGTAPERGVTVPHAVPTPSCTRASPSASPW